MLESDMFEPVGKLFEQCGYTVNAEVKDCDIVASKDDEIITVELKKDFNLKLIHQIISRQQFSDIVYAAISRPKCSYVSKRWTEITRIIRRLEAGLIVVSESDGIYYAEVAIEPAPFVKRKNTTKHRLIKNEIENRTVNYNKGGSTRKKLMTAYKENALYIACCLAKFGDLPVRAITKIGTGAKTAGILRNDHYGWYLKKDDGTYTLTEQGYAALDEYKALSEHYFKKIEDEIK